MKLADKPVYPSKLSIEAKGYDGEKSFEMNSFEEHPGITFREALILSLAGNPSIAVNEEYINGSGIFDTDAMKLHTLHEWNAIRIIKTADAIIKAMEV